ncbi:hypothetical protein E4U09_000792 [Claviceps aff. purpurea]|uniref:Uncharacterized protein n=1 Tax=Claviceps aff. purpurea TaxID=1967640 RepID=A0A9P7TZ83_9HYPO|nr:hypothetical protein E4U09_000792 [Claviceps aff. purpurea]
MPTAAARRMTIVARVLGIDAYNNIYSAASAIDVHCDRAIDGDATPACDAMEARQFEANGRTALQIPATPPTKRKRTNIPQSNDIPQ